MTDFFIATNACVLGKKKGIKAQKDNFFNSMTLWTDTNH